MSRKPSGKGVGHGTVAQRAGLGDSIAIMIQELRSRGRIDDSQPLLRIDYRKEAATAPFQFDMANARLHRTSCCAIPRGSKSALYAVWTPAPEDMELACKRCRPVMPVEGEEDEMANGKDGGREREFATDIIFGFLSIIDQFGSVLTERGREYRSSERGKEVVKAFENLYSELTRKQKEALDITVSSLDVLVGAVRRYNEGFGTNGTNGRSAGKGTGAHKKNGNGRPRG